MAEDNIVFYGGILVTYLTFRYIVKCWRNAAFWTLVITSIVCPISLPFYLLVRLFNGGFNFNFNLKLPGWLKRKPKIDESTMAGKAMGKGIKLSAHGDRGNLFRF